MGVEASLVDYQCCLWGFGMLPCSFQGPSCGSGKSYTMKTDRIGLTQVQSSQ
ncbi:hypothetical protein SP41_106 [Salmonella phage 41]|nr:hypothetical protein SP41_106 [Salmonella phage 41]